MDRFVIQGGTRLVGQVTVSGSKNATLPILAAALLTDDELILNRVPHLSDVSAMSNLLRSLGVNVASDGAHQLSLTPFDSDSVLAESHLMRQLRAGICVLGPLLAKRGVAKISLPGGCNIGLRPIELHLKGLEKLGAKITLVGGDVIASADRLKGAEIYLGGPFGSTVTGTCNIMSAATLATGKTIINAAATEPEVVALADALNAMGAKITGHGSSRIEIIGVEELHGAELEMMPDRIEAATQLIAAAMTGGDVTITEVNADHLSSPIELLRQIGCQVDCHGDRITIEAVNRPLKAFELSALPYPGLPTDLQALFMALACQTQGRTSIRDFVFPHRIMHSAELCRLGGSIHPRGEASEVIGPRKLMGTSVVASDLRAAAALVIAGLAAQGETIVHGIHHLDRGYEQFERKLNSLGAQIERVSDSHSELNFEAHQLAAQTEHVGNNPIRTRIGA